MAENRQPESVSRSPPSEGICSIAVRGFKCLAEESRIEIRPLTILAGANSSGKSSIMQPLLLMKQTLQASYDPGALLLNGPNVKLTSVEQLVPRSRVDPDDHTITFSVEAPESVTHRITYSSSKNHEVEIREMDIESGNERISLRPDRKEADLKADMLRLFPMLSEPPEGAKVMIHRNRCFLAFVVGYDDEIFPITFFRFPSNDLNRMIHVPGLRGNPERVYERTASGSSFPGTFEKYVATVIAEWTRNFDPRLKGLQAMLAKLGMTRDVAVRPVNDAQLELQVGRLLEVTLRRQDFVNVADVGFGVSQVLPVLVALLVAETGQLVYIEQPELHLHPRAQYELARVMADAAKRGVKVVAETHSGLLLLQIQTLLAKGEIDPDLVRLHWFLRNPDDGKTSIRPADLDENGAFGDWPEDFGDVEMEAEGAYLDAVEERS